MKAICIIAFFFSFLSASHAGVREHFLYDVRDRDQIKALDAVVKVKILNYYAFGDLGLIETVIRERKNIDLRPTTFEAGRAGGGNDAGREWIYSSFPGENEVGQLLRNTLWLLEAEVLETLHGSVQTNRVYIAARTTRAYDLKEAPKRFLKESFDGDLYFGLVGVEDEEFVTGFLGMRCFLRNDLSFLDVNYVEDLDSMKHRSDYLRFFRSFTPSPCYVAREIGVQPKDQTEKCRLLQALERGGPREKAMDLYH